MSAGDEQAAETDVIVCAPNEALDGCYHPGKHCRAIGCPDCGRFSRHSWETGPIATMDGTDYMWGGICETHGHWSESSL